MGPLIPPYSLIRNKLREGRVIPFLGSGASLGLRAPDAAWKKGQTAYLPNAIELMHYLAQMTEFPQDEPYDLAKVAQYYNVVGGRNALYEELHHIFNYDYHFTSLHTFLADMDRPLLIVTTNYDDLIERALKAKNKMYDVVIHTTAPYSGDRLLCWMHDAPEPYEVSPNKLDIDFDNTTVIYKMHGAVDRYKLDRDQYVITEDDYIDFLTRMTRNKAIPSAFAEPFQTRHFLFLGYGLRDWNLRVVLNCIEKDLCRGRRLQSWAIQYQPSPLEQRFWQDRHVEVYDMTINKFVEEMNSPSIIF